MNTDGGVRPRGWRAAMLFAVGLVLALAMVLAPTGAGQQPAGDALDRIRITSAASGSGKTLTELESPPGLPEDAAPLVRTLWSRAPRAMSAVETMSPQASAGNATWWLVSAEFQNDAARAAMSVRGATVLTAHANFAEIFIPSDASGQRINQEILLAVLRTPGLRWVDFPAPIEVPPPPPRSAAAPTREEPERIVRGGAAGMTGRGVIVVVVDSGLDFRHPDFITYDAAGRPTSRLLYLWDTTRQDFDAAKLGSKPPYSYPNGASIGTLYTREQLTAELRATSRRIPPADTNGHGTAVAGIAAGNGNAAGEQRADYAGVAPDADLIGVRIGGDTSGLANAWLLNAAAAWVDRVATAAGKPAVINCSFGGHSTPHDGTTVAERHLTALFPPTARGRAIVISAGNEGNDGIHAQARFTGQNQAGPFLWFAERNTILRVFFRGPAPGALKLEDLSFQTPALQGQGIASAPPQLLSAYVRPQTGEAVAEFLVSQGISAVVFWHKAGQQVQADAYLGSGFFQREIQRPAELVGDPGTAEGAITVASYDWNNRFHAEGRAMFLKDTCGNDPMVLGALSCYSSPGLSRSGTVKPEIAAPGQWFAASHARLANGEPVNPGMADTTGHYRLFNGTSAAAPYATGVIALMFQKKPTLTAGEVKRLLGRHATADARTGRVPNPQWGYGKLDYAAVINILNAIQ